MMSLTVADVIGVHGAPVSSFLTHLLRIGAKTLLSGPHKEVYSSRGLLVLSFRYHKQTNYLGPCVQSADIDIWAAQGLFIVFASWSLFIMICYDIDFHFADMK